MGRLLAITLPNFSTQSVWAILQVFGTPYLKTLGFTDAQTALVWLSGPVAGLLAQPTFGVLSDHCTSRWGKRMPFICKGAAAVIANMTTLAWAAELANAVLWLFGVGYGGAAAGHTARLIAGLSVLFICIGMQALQVGLRSLPVDLCPTHQQGQASLWSSRFAGLGAVFAGVLGAYGSTDFRFFAAVTSVLLALATLASWLILDHHSPAAKEATDRRDMSVLFVLGYLKNALSNLPPVTRRTCETQLFSWFAWFSILHYTSTYISQTHMAHRTLYHAGTISPEAAQRSGNQGGLVFSIVGVMTNFAIPKVLRAFFGKDDGPGSAASTATLLRLWQLSLVLLACCMFGTLFATSSGPATAIIGLAGVSWAMCTWIPFALITAELSLIQASQANGGDVDIRLDMLDQTGTVLGIHNIAITLPQVIAAFASTTVFGIAQVFGARESVVYAFQLAGLAASIAAWKCA
ncbi:Major facilitator superfamily domain general substrate transporter [Macrophomina phaseolina MS6]|uniref:Major facilitator superfamily domain general substrate transporter n=1 Tax=Macrophomina phaseolina (strain MS6) TaxID=1126212 RepID=K2SHM4_MACPH|nr:Major facilitator superfamily domain general substrate transporter [Macrophomina phaseolina MS6]